MNLTDGVFPFLHLGQIRWCRSSQSQRSVQAVGEALLCMVTLTPLHVFVMGMVSFQESWTPAKAIPSPA
jgi:hypothetical protein